eukprot:1402894-Rhodomonas_salina.2
MRLGQKWAYDWSGTSVPVPNTALNFKKGTRFSPSSEFENDAMDKARTQVCLPLCVCVCVCVCVCPVSPLSPLSSLSSLSSLLFRGSLSRPDARALRAGPPLQGHLRHRLLGQEGAQTLSLSLPLPLPLSLALSLSPSPSLSLSLSLSLSSRACDTLTCQQAHKQTCVSVADAAAHRLPCPRCRTWTTTWAQSCRLAPSSRTSRTTKPPAPSPSPPVSLSSSFLDRSLSLSLSLLFLAGLVCLECCRVVGGRREGGRVEALGFVH